MSEQATSLEQRLAQREDELTKQSPRPRRRHGDAPSSRRRRPTREAAGRLQAARDEIEAFIHSDLPKRAAREGERGARPVADRDRDAPARAGRDRRATRGGRARGSQAAAEREEFERELAQTSAEVQAELAPRRGALPNGREGGARVARRTGIGRDRAATELARDPRRSGTSLAARSREGSAARVGPRGGRGGRRAPSSEEVLRASQERLASQTEKLIEVEERAHSAERQLADSDRAPGGGRGRAPSPPDGEGAPRPAVRASGRRDAGVRGCRRRRRGTSPRGSRRFDHAVHEGALRSTRRRRSRTSWGSRTS